GLARVVPGSGAKLFAKAVLVFFAADVDVAAEVIDHAEDSHHDLTGREGGDHRAADAPVPAEWADRGFDPLRCSAAEAVALMEAGVEVIEVVAIVEVGECLGCVRPGTTSRGCGLQLGALGCELGGDLFVRAWIVGESPDDDRDRKDHGACAGDESPGALKHAMQNGADGRE